MRLSSSAFSDGGPIPRRFTCDGEDLSPPLSWSDPPTGTRSFALLCDDPDAPGGTFHHWAVYDIAVDRTELAQGSDRHADAQGFKRAANDFNRLGYGGPCPPQRHGPHRYQFCLLALSVDHLPLRKGSSCREVEREARKHALAEAGLVGTYER
ncbi:YbhB/YbcL family Raf kinase inhibitor-like protein [Methylocapsa aurea]|uniref:YbhB/YbcL family Raf kinase inhibitor-like protein n=1 Tax=Methylocapsa aurea TaxID=663610 RepID=UPI000564D848|nr:YbhB/YbcL family Raf kinase inhibitor-like protein [Methylocapsa aurea]